MKHPFDVHVGSKLRECRCMAGISRRQLGEQLGVAEPQIRNIETGTMRIDSDLMRKIVVTMGVPPSMFFEGLAESLGSHA